MIWNVLTIIFILISAYLFLRTIFWFVWFLDRYATAPRITFKAFKEMYVINTKSWWLGTDNPQYRTSNHDWIDIEFKSYHDYLLYKLFVYKAEKDEAYVRRLENEAELIKCMQGEINDYRERNLRQMKKVLEK